MRCSRSTSVLLALALAGGGLATLGATPAAAAPEDNDFFYGLTDTGAITQFSSGDGAAATGGGDLTNIQTITGLDANQEVVGIDVQPTTGDLYAVAAEPGNGDASLYIIDPTTGAADKVGDLTDNLVGQSFGLDFNNIGTGLVVSSNTGQYLIVSATSGASALVASNVDATGLAISSANTVYGLDIDDNQLVTVATTGTPAVTTVSNVGTLTNSPLTDSEAGFDIAAAGDGTAYAVVEVSGDRGLYQVDLSGPGPVLDRVGNFDLNDIVDITRAIGRVGFADTVGFVTPTIEVAEASGSATVTVTRTGDVSEALSVNYATSPSSATTPADFFGETGTVSFAAGQRTATFSVAIVNDGGATEADESFTVTLTSPSGDVELTSQATLTVTITDDEQGDLVYGLTTDNRLVRIDTADGTANAGLPITGLDDDDELVGFDFRASNRTLVAVAINTTTERGSIYTIDATTAAATKVSTLVDAGTSVPLLFPNVDDYAVDINPTSDALRIINAVDDTNLRATIATGSTVTDGDITSTAAISGAGYTNSVAGATSTELYGIDVAGDDLVEISPPNDGTVIDPVDLGLGNIAGPVGFDIDGATGTGYLSVNADATLPSAELYTVDVSDSTNPATPVAGASDLDNVEDVTVASDPVATPSPTFTVADATVAEGGTATITVTRSGSSAAGATVAYATSNGTATAGSDYDTTSGTLSFGAGVTSQTFTVATTEDAVAESSETVTLTLSNPSGGGTVGAAGTLTITDNDAAATIATSLTINASPFVRWPTTPVITGVLRNASTGAPLPGRTVYVIYKQQSVSGLAAFRPVLKLTTNAQGVYRGAIRPTVNAVWRALYLGSATEQVAGSKYDVTKMQITNPTVNGFGTTLTVRSGTQVNVSGRVLPGNVEHPVVLQWIRPDGIFNLNQLSRANSAGFYVSSRVFDRRDTYRLRILGVNTDNNVHSASRTFVLRVV